LSTDAGHVLGRPELDLPQERQVVGAGQLADRRVRVASSVTLSSAWATENGEGAGEFVSMIASPTASWIVG
jgi:hypothetical protein